jgi:uncharacterized protein YoxC
VQVRNPFEGLPKQITSAIGDVRRIAERMQTLPEILKTLRNVETSAASLDEEVKLMRASVNRLEEDVKEMRGTLHPLQRAFRRKPTS